MNRDAKNDKAARSLTRREVLRTLGMTLAAVPLGQLLACSSDDRVRDDASGGAEGGGTGEGGEGAAGSGTITGGEWATGGTSRVQP